MDQAQDITIRVATREDAALVHEMVCRLAQYEKRPQDVTASVEELAHGLFDRHWAEVLLCQRGEETVGYALWYPVFASFSGRGGLYLEDVFVDPALRGLGLGKRMMAAVAQRGLAAGCTAMNWSCLEWNEAGLGFYRHLGAHQKGGNLYFSMDEAQMRALTL